jgi:hypothetical protein
MQFRSRKGFVAAAIALLCGVALAQETVVRLGHAAPMSGEQSHYGRDNVNGAILAVEDLNAKAITSATTASLARSPLMPTAISRTDRWSCLPTRAAGRKGSL